MKKEKVLEVQIKEINDEWSVFYISYQNDKIFERGVFNDRYLDVVSENRPYFYVNKTNNNGYVSELYIRGTDETQDNYVVGIRNEYIHLLIDKVKAINEKYGTPKRWRAEYEKTYFYIESYGRIDVTGDFRRCSDNKRYEIGNYFKTEDEAKSKLESFKKVFKGV